MKKINCKEIRNSISQLYLHNIWGALYLCLLVISVSFYMTDGYVNIGEDKYVIFKGISLYAIPVWIMLKLTDAVIHRDTGEKWYAKRPHMQKPDIFIVLFGVAAVISTLTSSFRLQSIEGTYSWRMGMVVMLIMVFLYFVSRDLAEDKNQKLKICVEVCFCIVTSVVFILGILNRFSIYPLVLNGQEEDFISTLGNINWFCGYWTLWTGMGFGKFINASDRKSRLWAGIYVWLCSVTGICCGADSVYLAWGMILLVSFMLVLGNEEYLKRWALMQLIVISAMPSIRVIGALRPNKMWYWSSFLKETSYGIKWVIPFAFLGVIFVLFIFFAKWMCAHSNMIRALVAGAFIAAIGSVLLLIVLNTVIKGGIWPVRGMSLFTFSSRWGNGRGAIWIASAKTIKNMPFFQMFFGVGCDCFSSFAYSVDEVAVYLRRMLGPSITLTNAHIEAVTLFINEGIFGLVCFAGIVISVIRHVKACLFGNGLVLGGMLALTGYLAIGMVSFMQVLSTPFLFIIMGFTVGLTNGFGLNTIGDVDK